MFFESVLTAGLGEFLLSGNVPPVFNKSGKGRIFFRLGKPVRRAGEPGGEDCHGEIGEADEAGQKVRKEGSSLWLNFTMYIC